MMEASNQLQSKCQPAETAVATNYYLRALSLLVDFLGEKVYQGTGLRLSRDEISTPNRAFLDSTRRLTLVNNQREPLVGFQAFQNCRWRSLRCWRCVACNARCAVKDNLVSIGEKPTP